MRMRRQPQIMASALAGLAVAAGLSGCGSSASSKPKVKPVGPVGLSADGLRTLDSAIAKQPIYWIGPKPHYLYELTRSQTGNVLIRYLPPGANVGSRKPYLTIATYPYKNAFQALENVANGRQLGLPGGGIAVVDQKYPQSVHVAYPGVNYQVEVYDPSPVRSRQVALSGAVRPVS
jgi:hypothetical protein